MAAIWRDVEGSPNNDVYSNTDKVYRFKFRWITFSSEALEKAEVRWRKAGNAAKAVHGIKSVMQDQDAEWFGPVTISRFEDTTTWTLSGGQYVPPAEASRKFSNIEFMDFPVGALSNGVWVFQVRGKVTGGDWTGWVNHRFEINTYENLTVSDSSASSVTLQPNFPAEGGYGVRVTAVSASGIDVTSAPVAFRVVDTDRHILVGANTTPANEYIQTESGTERVTR